ncbi:MAG: hypothetical protein GEV11_27710, partial [Streptosporangiales bacterium]|nr:hypothetical protein [Streptosporangiales bacterium]
MGGIAGVAATALLVTAPGALADHEPAPADPCDGRGEVVSHSLRATPDGCRDADRRDAEATPDADDRPTPHTTPREQNGDRTPKPGDASADPRRDAGESPADRGDDGQNDSHATDGQGESQSPADSGGEGAEASGSPGPDGHEQQPGRPESGTPKPDRPEAKGRIEADLTRDGGRVRAGATLNYRLDLDVRGTVRGVTAKLRTNLGTWTVLAPTREADRAKGAADDLSCVADGGRVRCSAEELTAARQVKLKLRLPEQISAAKLKVTGKVTASGKIDVVADTAAVAETGTKGDGQDADGSGGDNANGTGGQADDTGPNGTGPNGTGPNG